MVRKRAGSLEGARSLFGSQILRGIASRLAHPRRAAKSRLDSGAAPVTAVGTAPAATGAGATTVGTAIGRAARPTRSPSLAAFLSFLFPGAGQLYLGRRLWAAIFGIPTLLTILWGILQLGQGLTYFAFAMLDTNYSRSIMAVAAAFTLWRMAAIAQPFLIVRPTRFSLPAGALLAVLLLLTVGAGDVVFSNAYNAYSASQQMASNDFAEATPVPTATPVPGTPPPSSLVYTRAPTEEATASDTPAPSPTKSIDPCAIANSGGGLAAGELTAGGLVDVPGALSPFALTPVAYAGAIPNLGDPTPAETTPSPEPTPSPSPSPTPTPAPPAVTEPPATPAPPTDTPPPAATPVPTPTATPTPTPKHNRMTILLTGVDFIAGRQHALNDTLMLVSIDLDTRAVAMVSVPRDSAGFPFYWGGDAPANFKINGLADAIAGGRFGSPDPPMLTLAKEVGYLVGIKTDYYAEIDMDGFRQMIDLVGGVDVYNPKLLDDPSTCSHFAVGNVHLTGRTALRYVRSRETSNDYQRASRQQIVMMALEKKIATPAMLPKLGSLLGLAGKSIATNFPLGSAKDYVKVAENLSGISRCVLGPPYNYHPDSATTGGSWTSRLLLAKVASLSIYLFGSDSRYYPEQIPPASCQNRS